MMINISGVTIPHEYLPTFEWVEDIQYFEGTLTAEYKTSKGELYVFHWCDSTSQLNRWLAVRTNRRALYELTSGITTFRNFFEERILDSNIYILDINNNEDIVSSLLVHLADIPREYLPDSGILISPSLIPVSLSKKYPVLIDGDWSEKELSEFPRKFMDTYSFIDRYISRNENELTNTLTSYPWAGGYSSTNFYSMLRERITRGFHRLFGMSAIQYASPGYMQFVVDRQVALLVKKNVDSYITDRERIDDVFREITSYLRENDLNNERVSPDTNQINWLRTHGESLMLNFSEPRWDWIFRYTPDAFIAVKVSMSYYRRIKPLADYVQSNRAQFGKF